MTTAQASSPYAVGTQPAQLATAYIIAMRNLSEATTDAATDRAITQIEHATQPLATYAADELREYLRAVHDELLTQFDNLVDRRDRH